MKYNNYTLKTKKTDFSVSSAVETNSSTVDIGLSGFSVSEFEMGLTNLSEHKWYSEETDASQITTSTSNSIAVFAGDFNQGPVQDYTAIENVSDLIDFYGYPDNYNYNDWYQAYNFLQYADTLYLTRAANIDGTASLISGLSILQVGEDTNDPDQTEVTAAVAAQCDIAQAITAGAAGNNILITVTEGTSYEVAAVAATSTVGTAKSAGLAGNNIVVNVYEDDPVLVTEATFAFSSIGTAVASGDSGNDIRVVVEDGESYVVSATTATSTVATAVTAGSAGNDIVISITEGDPQIQEGTGTAASSDIGTAKTTGVEGNDIKVIATLDETQIVSEASTAFSSIGHSVNAGADANDLKVIVTETGTVETSAAVAASSEIGTAVETGVSGNLIRVDVTDGGPELISEATAAECEVATALVTGEFGNNIRVSVTEGEPEEISGAIAATSEIGTAVTAGAEGNNLTVEVQQDEPLQISESSTATSAIGRALIEGADGNNIYVVGAKTGDDVVTEAVSASSDIGTAVTAGAAGNDISVEVAVDGTRVLVEPQYATSTVGTAKNIGTSGNALSVSVSEGTPLETVAAVKASSEVGTAVTAGVAGNNLSVEITDGVAYESVSAVNATSEIGTAVEAGTNGNNLTVEVVSGTQRETSSAVNATSEVGTAVNAGADGNNISVEITDGTPVVTSVAVNATSEVGTAVNAGADGNNISVEITDGTPVVTSVAVAASCDYGVASTAGAAGNNLAIIVTQEAEAETFTVTIEDNGSQVFGATEKATTDDLGENDYITWTAGVTLVAGTYNLSGGSDEVTAPTYTVVTNVNSEAVDTQSDLQSVDSLQNNSYVNFSISSFVVGTYTFSGGSDEVTAPTYTVVTNVNSEAVDTQSDLQSVDSLQNNSYVNFSISEFTTGTYTFSGGSDEVTAPTYTVTTKNGDDVVDTQADLQSVDSLTNNSYVNFSISEFTTGTYTFSGGSDEVTAPTYTVVTNVNSEAVDTQSDLQSVDSLQNNSYVNFSISEFTPEIVGTYQFSGGADAGMVDTYDFTVKVSETTVATQTGIAYASELVDDAYIVYNKELGSITIGTYTFSGGIDAVYLPTYTVTTKNGDETVDTQSNLLNVSELTNNDYVEFSIESFTVGTYTFSGGSDAEYQTTYTVVTKSGDETVDTQSDLASVDALQDNDYIEFSIETFAIGDYTFSGGVDEESIPTYSVVTKNGDETVDTQSGLADRTELVDNSLVSFNKEGSLTAETYTFSGGADAVTESVYTFTTYYNNEAVDVQDTIKVPSDLVDNAYVHFETVFGSFAMLDLASTRFSFTGGADAEYQERFIVITKNGDETVDTQVAITSMADVADNAYVIFNKDCELEVKTYTFGNGYDAGYQNTFTVTIYSNDSRVEEKANILTYADYGNSSYVTFKEGAILAIGEYQLSGGAEAQYAQTYNVTTFYNSVKTNELLHIQSSEELQDNQYVTFNPDYTLTIASYQFSGGAEAVESTAYSVETVRVVDNINDVVDQLTDIRVNEDGSKYQILDTQVDITSASELVDNEYVVFNKSINLTEGEYSFTGGTDAVYENYYTVVTYYEDAVVDTQSNITETSELVDNDYVVFNDDFELTEGTYEFLGGLPYTVLTTYNVATVVSGTTFETQYNVLYSSSLVDNYYVTFNKTIALGVGEYELSGGTDSGVTRTFNVTTYNGTSSVDTQRNVTSMEYLVDNTYVEFNRDASLATGTYQFSGGADAVYQDAYAVETVFANLIIDTQEQITQASELVENDYVIFTDFELAAGTYEFSGGSDQYTQETFNVTTTVGTITVDSQLGVTGISGLRDNSYVSFISYATLAVGEYQLYGGADAEYKDMTKIYVNNVSNISVGDVIAFSSDTQTAERYMIAAIDTVNRIITLDRDIEDDQVMPEEGGSIYKVEICFNGSIEATHVGNVTTTSYNSSEDEVNSVDVPNDVGDQYSQFDSNKQVLNDSDFDDVFDSIAFSNPSQAKVKFISRNPGSWCQKLKICIARPESFSANSSDADFISHYAFEGLPVDDYFEYAPTGTQVGVLIYDEDEEEVLETYTVDVEDEEAKDYNNKSTWIETVINQNSSYVYVKVNSSCSEEIADYTLVYDAVKNEYVGKTLTFMNYSDADITQGDLEDAYDIFSNKEEIDIDIVIANELDNGSSAANLALDREDCIGFIGARYEDIVAQKAATATSNLVNWRKNIINYNSSFLCALGNYKYQYDRELTVA